MKLIGTVIGTVLGAAGGKKDAAIGAAVGFLAASAVEGIQRRRFLKESQFEADQFAAQVLLEHGFDAREAPILLAKVGNIVRRSGPAVELAFVDAGDLNERSARMKTLLDDSYSRPSRVSFPVMDSVCFTALQSALVGAKRDNGLLALDRDLFLIARRNLEEAASVRTDDPLTMYGLGMLYRMVGRTDRI